MRIIETYSHYNGLEFLEIHRHDLLGELQQLVKAFDIYGVGKAGLRSKESSFRNDPQSRRYHEQLESRGWHNSDCWRMESFSKQRIALKFCFGLRAGEERLEFDEFCSRYRHDEIDVVVSGHAHSFTNALVANANGKPILVTQAFASGTAYADIDLAIDPARREVRVDGELVRLAKKRMVHAEAPGRNSTAGATIHRSSWRSGPTRGSPRARCDAWSQAPRRAGPSWYLSA